MLGGGLALFVYCHGWSRCRLDRRCRLRGHFESWRSFRQRRLLDGSGLRPVRRVRRFSRASSIVNLGDGLGAHGWSRCRLRGHFESWRSFRQRRLLDGSGLRPVRRVRRFSRASGIVNLGDGLGAHGWSRCRLRGQFESWRSFRQRRLLDGSGLRPVRRVRRFSRASGIVNLGDGLGAHAWSRCRLRGHFESWRSFRQRRLLDGSGLRPVRRVRRFSRASSIVNLGDGLGAHSLEQVPAPRPLRELEKLQTTPAARRQRPPPRAARPPFQSR